MPGLAGRPASPRPLRRPAARAWCSRSSSRPLPGWCCSTSRPAASTTRPRSGSPRCSASSPPRAGRWSSRPTTSSSSPATADRVVVLAEGEVVADGPTADVVVASPAFAPQVAKVLHPDRWLTVDEVAARSPSVERVGRRDRRAGATGPCCRRGAPYGRRPAGRVRWRGWRCSCWPLVIDPPADFSHTRDAPYIFVLILPVLVAIVLTELTGRGIDTKALAMLGVLSAIGAVAPPARRRHRRHRARVLPARARRARVRPGFGFVLGSTTLFASALLTGGIGPWLPFQMLASSWVGLARRPAPARAGPGRDRPARRVRRAVGLPLRLPA